MLEFLGSILAIVVIDLVLSGDNAVVIGLAARSLSPENRRRAIVFGGAGAVILRIIFTALAVFLLSVPYLKAAGGLLLFYIAYRLVRPQASHDDIAEAGTLREAIQTIVLADVVMSLDNILAVGGAAHGDIRLLLFGLVLSIPILLLGAEVVARLLGRFPILVYVGCIILIYTAVDMVLEDRIVHNNFPVSLPLKLAISVVASVVIIGGARWIELRQRSQLPQSSH